MAVLPEEVRKQTRADRFGGEAKAAKAQGGAAAAPVDEKAAARLARFAGAQ